MSKFEQNELIQQERLQKRLMNRSSSSEEEEGSSKNPEDTRTRASLMEQEDKKQERKKAKDAKKTFKRLFGYTWRFKGQFFLANISLAVSSLGFVFLPLICGQMVDEIKNNGDLMDGTIKFIILTVVMAVFSAIRGYIFSILGERIMVAMRQELFDKLITKDISYYDTNKTGELLSRLGNDIATVYSVCSDNISILLRNILQLIGSLLLLWLISWELTLFILILTPIISLVVLKIVQKMKLIQKEYSNNLAYTSSLATEVFSNIRVVRSFANEKLESKNYEGLLNKLFKTGKRKHIMYGLMLLITTTFANVLILVILYFGGRLVIDGDLTIGDLTSFVLYTITLTVGFASVSGIINQLISAIGICEHIFQIMDEPVNVVSGILKPNLNEVNGPMIQFVDATFAYPSKPTVQVLKKVNLKINHGESVAVVGPSGSGKSSIVSLILRFYDLNQGSIMINGKSIKDINTNSLREQIGFVSQEPTLFSGNLKENVEYGLRQSSENDSLINDALDIANAKEFVYDAELFPEHLQTLVGERGVKLSGGQKQRIAIARCMAKDPKILIFDEATSALDAESEYQVQKAIDGLVGKRDRTMVIVAHRLSTIMNCDRILVIKHGELVEEGSHSELLARKGVYANLVERQLAKH